MGKRIFTLTIATALVLAGCGESKEALEKFYNKVEKANKQEEKIVELNEKMAKSEQEKVKKIEKLNKAKDNTFKSLSKEIVDDIDERETIIKEEKGVMAKSKSDFQGSEDLIDAIDDKDYKKEAQELKEALNQKYELHDQVVKGYEEVLETERELFSYLSEDGATQKGADQRSKDLTSVNKKTEKTVTKYQNQLSKVQQEKQDVNKLLNN